MRSNFLLGELIITDAVRERLGRMPLDLVARHAVNEHGQVTVRELRANQAALNSCDDILSRYPVDPTDPSQGFVIVITRGGWDETRVQLDYEL